MRAPSRIRTSFSGIKQATLLLIHVLHADLDGASVGLELLHLGELHDCRANVAQTFGCEVCASDVLDVGAEVDTRVLLGVTVGGCEGNVSLMFRINESEYINLRREWLTPAE
jgi:hypothetical protein